jgi:hypothetical protein
MVWLAGLCLLSQPLSISRWVRCYRLHVLCVADEIWPAAQPPWTGCYCAYCRRCCTPYPSTQ